MYLTELRLINFRNYARLDEQFDPGLMLLHGENAQGKTNFLEAIAFLATVKSARARYDRQLIHFDAAEEGLPFAHIEARVRRQDGEQRVRIVLSMDDNGSRRTQKNIFLNEARQTIIDYVGEINVVQFLPEDISLIASSPGVRRRYLDDTICQIDRDYARDLSTYNETLRQRNATLKELQERGGDASMLDLYDEPLVQNGAYIIMRRQQVLSLLDELVTRIHADLTGGRERLRIQYLPELELGYMNSHQLSLGHDPSTWGVLDMPLSLNEVEERFQEQLHEKRSYELERGVTTIGPHRDDVRFLVNSVDLTDFGSRGQQRTATLALKLGEVALITEKKSEPPILLLDDVMSELDDSRREFLGGVLHDHEQVFLTTTDPDQLAPELREASRTIRIIGGRFFEE